MHRDGAAPRPLPGVHRAFPGVFYGWFVVAGAGLLAFVGVGVGFYGQTVFLDGLTRERGWAPASVAGASSFYFILSGLVGTWVGRLTDRYGAPIVIVMGSLVMGAGLVAVGDGARPQRGFFLRVLIADDLLDRLP